MVAEAKRKEAERAQAEYQSLFERRRNADLEEAKQEVKELLVSQEEQLKRDQDMIAGMQELQFSEHEKMMQLRQEVLSAHRAEEEARKRVAKLRVREAVREMTGLVKEKQRKVSAAHVNAEGLDDSQREEALKELSASLHKELNQAKHVQRRASTDLRIDLGSLGSFRAGQESVAPSRQTSGTVAPRTSVNVTAMADLTGGPGGAAVAPDVVKEMLELQQAMDEAQQLMSEVGWWPGGSR